MRQEQLDEAIERSLRDVGEKLEAGHPVLSKTGAICLSKENATACLRGVPNTNEIEFHLKVFVDFEEHKYSGDIVQVWLGDPVHAFEISNSSYSNVAQVAAEFASRALRLLLADRRAALKGLERAQEQLLDKSRIEWLRYEAVDAMRRRDIERLKKIHAEDSSILTLSERARYKI